MVRLPISVTHVTQHMLICLPLHLTHSQRVLKVLFVLFEHAAGYAIFRCREVEDVGSLLPEVQVAMADFSLFTATVSLEAFSPFKTGVNALENINSVSEGMKGLNVASCLCTLS